MIESEQNVAGAAPEGTDGVDTPRRFQFGIRALLIAMAAVAVGCSVVSMPPIVAVPILLFCMISLPAVLTTMLVYGTTRQRTFSIGALFPAGFVALWLSFFAMSWAYGGAGDAVVILAIVIGIAWIASAAAGVLCVWVRYLIERRYRVGNSTPDTSKSQP
jgi:hypothetical protein